MVRCPVSWACIAILLASIIAMPDMDAGGADAFPATRASRLPIRIDGNWDFTAANGVTGGCGTPEDPWAIEGWDISGHGYGYCIYIGNTTEHFIVRDCDLHDARQNYAMYYYTESGLILHRVSNGTVSGNRVHDNDFDGAYLHNCSHVNVEDNEFTGNRWGIVLMGGSDNNTLRGNAVNDSLDYGIGLIDSPRNSVLDNNVSSNAGYGIYLSCSDANTVSGNSVSANDVGLCLETTSGNTISANNITSNAGLGLDLWQSSGNRVCHNNVLGNGQQAKDDTGANSWDNGYPSGGNHWTGYSGIDANLDGIGDSAYTGILGGMGARDRYPFMKAWFLDAELPVASAGPDMEVDEGTVVRLNGSASSDNVGVAVYTWTFIQRGADVVLSGVSPAHNFTLPGIYTVLLEARDSAGNRGTDTMTVTVNDITPPAADAGPDRELEEGGTAIFNGSASTDNVGIAEYVWKFSDGISEMTLNGCNQSHMFGAAGTYPVLLNVTDAAGNWDTDAMTVTVNADATPPIAAAGQDRNAAAGALVWFNGSGSTDNVLVANYTWELSHNGTLFTLFGMNGSFRFWTPGNYTVTLTVRDLAGNTGTDSLAVRVTAQELPDGEVPEDGTEETDGGAGWAMPAMLIGMGAACAAAVIIIGRRKRPGKGSGEDEAQSMNQRS